MNLSFDRKPPNIEYINDVNGSESLDNFAKTIVSVAALKELMEARASGNPLFHYSVEFSHLDPDGYVNVHITQTDRISRLERALAERRGGGLNG